MMWILWMGCSTTPEPAPEPEPAGPDPKEALVALHMTAHAKKVTEAREALIHGQLEEAKQALDWLASHAAPVGLPDEATPYLEAMQEAANQGATAERYDGVGEALGTLAVTCGRCHTALGAKPRLESTAAPPDDLVRSHMVHHAAGVDQLWASLVTPDPAMWRTGVETLGEPLDDEAYEVPVMTASSRASAALVHEAPKAALADPDPAKRGAAYGQVITACATCHAEMRGE